METRSKLVLSFGFVCSMYAYFGQAITMATCIALFVSVAMYYITKYTLYIGLFAFFYLHFGQCQKIQYRIFFQYFYQFF